MMMMITMMETSVKPSESKAALIAPILPSIISSYNRIEIDDNRDYNGNYDDDGYYDDVNDSVDDDDNDDK